MVAKELTAAQQAALLLRGEVLAGAVARIERRLWDAVCIRAEKRTFNGERELQWMAVQRNALREVVEELQAMAAEVAE